MTIKSLRELEIFCSLIEAKSFVAAARALGTSPSSVTRALQALEQQLGVVLLRRSHKDFSLTLAGESYYEHARQILDLEYEAEEKLVALTSTPRGWIRLSAPETLSTRILPQALAQLAANHPDLHFDVLHSDATLDPVEKKLDLAIRGGFLHDSDLIAYPLWRYRRHMYASPAYLERHAPPISPSGLATHAILMHTSPRILKDWHFIAQDARTSLTIRPTHRFNSGGGLLAAAEAGLGIARLADWLAAEACRAGRLQRVCPDWRVVSSRGEDPVMHAVSAHRSLTRNVELLLEALRMQAPAQD
ncbi:LysR family transcriptional regulator [Paludibacterium yongneupense]|uniref:LysR family transcriptional regulator n=1 Tax=Paludibacterium yongneupense TaxID=400061 RepID=UPI00048FF531|nr:LysR family transcriptional regulator [Paludibacterium yongneupense]